MPPSMEAAATTLPADQGVDDEEPQPLSRGRAISAPGPATLTDLAASVDEAVSAAQQQELGQYMYWSSTGPKAAEVDGAAGEPRQLGSEGVQPSFDAEPVARYCVASGASCRSPRRRSSARGPRT